MENHDTFYLQASYFLLARCYPANTYQMIIITGNHMGVFRGRGGGVAAPNRPKNCRSTTTKDRLAALLLLRCQAYWIRKPDDSTSFSSVNELKEIAEVVLLIDISAAFLSCVLCVHIATGLAKKATPNTPHTTLPVNWPIFKIISVSHSP